MPAAPDPFIARRMRAQRLTAPMAADPAAVVGWFGAVQAQDYQGAKWALSLRAPGLTDARIDRALADGTIIRTHGPRPTWHFIAAADSRWVLAAVGSRVHLRTQVMYRQFEIDAALMTRVRRVFEKVLGGGGFATRAGLAKALAAKGIEASGVRLRLARQGVRGSRPAPHVPHRRRQVGPLPGRSALSGVARALRLHRVRGCAGRTLNSRGSPRNAA